MIWATQKYKSNNTILLVLCDQEYSEKDYIRDYEEFLNYKNSCNFKQFYNINQL